MSALGKIFCVITGGSRGLGRSLAIAISRVVSDGSTIILTARSTEALSETSKMVAETNANVTVKSVVADLGNLSAFEVMCTDILDGVDAKDYAQAILIHNAASHMGMTKFKGSEIDDPNAVSNYCNMHFSSTVCLTSKFISAFKGTRRVVVNVSSAAAVNPTPTRSLYCSMKAARVMFLRVMAAEDPDIRLLNYDPGLMKTDLLVNGIADSFNPEFWEGKIDEFDKKGLVVSADTSAEKLILALKMDKYENGSTVSVGDQIIPKI
ncbi:unnamed protein product [Owenia fusiformis]|uniref:Sepiapterin reductase n=1 Tax=Owenia fusiformis TaxID=6347 RepID=A0A8J1T534_OWEFU|nr:unnamed protein product [Owenia fusiformis]CAH1784674.1 unnamed protein product [Owenia fusiformis]